MTHKPMIVGRDFLCFVLSTRYNN